MSDRDSFGFRLRSERERRGISLETVAAVTKVAPALWEGLERNDLSRWPSGVFARGFIRDYARAVGLDADELVDEFCRLFPQGDRRAERAIRAHGELLGHAVCLDAAMVPPAGGRRATDRARQEQVRVRRLRVAPRAAAAGLDTGGVLLLAAGAAILLGTGFWPTAGAVGLAYYGVSTLAFGHTAGTRAVHALRQRVPALFTAQDRRVPA